MSLSREDLVAYALHGLDADEHARIEAALDDSSRAELRQIEEHLAKHDSVTEIHAPVSVWRGIERRLHEQPAPRSFVERFWMPMAAAALVLIAVLVAEHPDPLTLKRIHGEVAKAPDGSYTSSRVARIMLGTGVVVTMDTDTTIVPLSNERLALKAGRIFLSVSRHRRGFTVKAGDLEVVTTGTTFMVESERVAVVSGRVRCRYRGTTREVGAGEEFSPTNRTGPKPTEWFTRLTLSARILAPDRIEVVIRNEMPDAITKAPPTGGEPLFYATYRDGRSVPLPTNGQATTIALAPNAETSFALRLPAPLSDGEALIIRSPALGLSAEATR